MNNIMIDIETLGVKPGCAILSIGAVEFDMDGLGTEFLINVNPESCTKAGLTIEPRTVMWWLEQSDDARKALISRKNYSLDNALLELNKAFDWVGKKVWCNGASFDFPILEAGYEAYGAQSPWEFWNINDFRTMKNFVGKKILADIRKDFKGFTAHNALDDAKEQAMTLIEIFKRIKVS